MFSRGHRGPRAHVWLVVCTFVLSLRFCSSSFCCNCMFEARGSRSCSRILLAWNQKRNQPRSIVLSLCSGAISTHHASVACACSRLDVIQSDVAARLESQTKSAEASAVIVLSLHQPCCNCMFERALLRFSSLVLMSSCPPPPHHHHRRYHHHHNHHHVQHATIHILKT